MVHQPVEQIRIVIFQQANEQLFVSVAEGIVLILKERHDGDVEFAHPAAACPVDTCFIVNVHVDLPAAKYRLV
ncbi:hypothetical protein UUU_35790 [Klebsiella pneumoniae subsp. pneumoniae DSM 30104 = JCM 1662 = NBRC 14940]|nr:hypothetical protein UUU_35790 [Klebsiella pneumoniae subsp. pneumoniae DSM 30104 = JCM 1662 = NBRC 14940]